MFQTFKSVSKTSSHRTKQKQHSIKPGDLLLIHSAKQLLGLPRRKKLISATLPLLSLSEDKLETFCQPLLDNVTHFFQDLPETRHSFYARRGGLIDHALERTAVAMKLCRQYFLPAGTESKTLTEPQTLWAFALFSAGLLRDIGRVTVDLKILTHKDSSTKGKPWDAYNTTMTSQGTHYSYTFAGDYPETFRANATLLLARQLLPNHAFTWITSNRQVFKIWMAILQDDKTEYGMLGAILERAEAEAIIGYFRELGLPLSLRDGEQALHEGRSHLTGMTSISGNEASQEVELRQIAEHGAGIAFLNWLQSEMAQNKLMMNSAPLFSVPGGFLIGADILKLFVSQSEGKFSGADSVKRSLESLGILSKNSQNFIHANDKTKIEGHVLTNPHVVLDGLSKTLQTQYAETSKQFNNVSSPVFNEEQFITPAGVAVTQQEAQINTDNLVNMQNPFAR